MKTLFDFTVLKSFDLKYELNLCFPNSTEFEFPEDLVEYLVTWENKGKWLYPSEVQTVWWITPHVWSDKDLKSAKAYSVAFFNSFKQSGLQKLNAFEFFETCSTKFFTNEGWR